MISSSKWLSALPCVQPSALSLLGLLTSLSICAMALVISSTDQTGQQLTEVSRAFQSALSGHGLKGAQMSQDSAQLLVFEDAKSASRRILRNANGQNPSRTFHSILNDNAAGTFQDLQQPAWGHLLGELQRFCSVSAVDVIDGETAIDLLLPSETADQESVERICDVIQAIESRAIESQSEGMAFEYQLIVWAGSPSRSAILEAARRAAEIESRVQQHPRSVSSTPPRLSSSGQVWNDRKAIRPCISIVIRRIPAKNL